jgi:hypothetical protein
VKLNEKNMILGALGMKFEILLIMYCAVKSETEHIGICHSRCFGIRGGRGKSAFKLAVKPVC